MHKLTHCCLFITFLFITTNSVTATESKEKTLKLTQTKPQALREENTRRQLWALSEADWSRYKILMKGIRGSISPQNISPIEVLGTHARNDTERRKYAEIWATMRHDDVSRILAFQGAYDEAMMRLYPNEQIINTKLLNLVSETQYQPGDRMLVFVKTERCTECDAVIQRVMLDNGAKTLHMDIYFVDTKNKTDDDKIRQWARQQNIDVQRLKSGNITLNHDKGTLFRMTKKIISSVPLVFSLNSTGLTQVHY